MCLNEPSQYDIQDIRHFLLRMSTSPKLDEFYFQNISLSFAPKNSVAVQLLSNKLERVFSSNCQKFQQHKQLL